MIESLLQRWCDGMIGVQIDAPSDPSRHGAIDCPACGRIHGRCMDAVYPFFSLAKSSGNTRYLEAGKAVFEWSKNVSQPDGSWTVTANPRSWRGITVFGAIALAETLYHHGDLLDQATRERWTERLELAANYIYENFDLRFANINYGFTALYALNLLGRHLGEERYLARSRELAAEAPHFFTNPNHLLYGEAKPVNALSARGMLAVDLGYNVEESLNGLTLYALQERDESLLALLTSSLASHLEFMLPDGGWDNSWGTRQFKWTYWGSRTSDGCQIAYAAMAKHNSKFASAALRNTMLMERCTSKDGLLYGGIHYREEGLPPCSHHTFAHAKSLAYLLDSGTAPESQAKPLSLCGGARIKRFPEIATDLLSIGPWRATVTAYDFIYRPGVQQATGGTLSLLWHETLGPLCAASMADYQLVEPYNQQKPKSDIDFALTPRLEACVKDIRYSNLYDLKATFTSSHSTDGIQVDVSTKLNNRHYQSMEQTCKLSYRFAKEFVQIQVQSQFPARYVLPILSPVSDQARHPSASRIEIEKEAGTLTIESDSPLEVVCPLGCRTFNLVPGAQALPIAMTVAPDTPSSIRLHVS
ncbi:hypothetical protein IEN85_08430 [Pelagicoccus sp. NFK12]|uniref:Uncharacterized protein n=1 Tax=Pelagicoccus enzymogenes TaxID=2773457 RepID=A0A927IHA3_9BACT|nr:hypothetical protein [Pelagicoccus enzymogenes]MBD5779518.1 hypothetical protein [Pelagicoccus enzymogenes]